MSSRQRFAEYRERVTGTKPSATNVRVPGASGPSRTRSFGQLFRAFVAMLGGHRRFLTFSLLTVTVATLLKLIPPASTKVAIDFVLEEGPLPTWVAAWGLPQNRIQLLMLLAAGVIVTSLLGTVIHLWGRWYATKAVNQVQVDLRKRVFEHAVRLPLYRVYELKSGGAASILREDAGGASELVFSMIYNPWRAVVQLAGSLLVLAWVDWRMMAGALILIPVVYVTHRTWIHRIRPLWRDVRRQRQNIDGDSTEAFGGMRIVRAFARERTEASRFVRSNNLLIRQQLFIWCWSRVIEVTWSLLIPLCSTALLVYGGYRILEGTMTLGDLTMFLFYLLMLLEPLATLANSATSFQNNLAGLDRILDLLDEPREMPPAPRAIRLDRPRVKAAIRFHNVTFRYPQSERTVLDSITLDVAAGETIALVGRSGAGKTTLCNLVARFYDPTQGHIELDGHDLRDIELGSYRKLFGIVEQDVFLFDGTIAENIGYGRRRATPAQIQEAAEAAYAHPFISDLQNRYDTLIGERGVKLSGGQRQRLAIARALIADPRILILDEATSNLDSESEQLIQQALQRMVHGRTCFVIAHRMSTIGLADRIAVLDHGKLVAVGNHAELVDSSPVYRQMVQLQTLGDGLSKTPS